MQHIRRMALFMASVASVRLCFDDRAWGRCLSIRLVIRRNISNFGISN
ncbi:hypothetical protein SAMN05660226_00192 [Parapedobacter luteus]|uniref:Uncharacterized protein n=1 Tax=Parapedobacter luteus TaxID=623280 RepID=A0A1T4ZW69_9SPHI|nr:hypothetical protein SAMN05660226_00192 [Parapedobacter luteus]